MWQPAAGWQRLPGSGPSSAGVWTAHEDGRQVVIKRLVAPIHHEDALQSSPQHPAYWRRAADVALSGVVARTPGLREPPVVRVEEDAEGITLVHGWVEPRPLPASSLAACLGRFTTADVAPHPWLVRGQLAARLAEVERRGGWSTLARTPVADLADALWRRRSSFLARLADMPQVPQHGDPVPSNLWGADGDDVVALDWATLGYGPPGADLGYLALSVAEDPETLVQAYVDGAATGTGPHLELPAVRLAASCTAAFTVLTRADWALARVARGEGALAGKYRHPSLAPYIRALQRQLPLMKSLLEPRGSS